MNVVHLISSGGMYGAETMLLRLVAGQRRLGVDATIADVCPPGRDTSELGREARRQQLPVIRCEMRDGFDPPGAWRALSKLRGSCDVLHSHGYKMNVHLAMLTPLLRGPRTLATVHGWTSIGRFGKAALYQRLDAWALRAFQHVVLVSPAMRARPQLAGLRRVSVIQNGIDFANAPVRATAVGAGRTPRLLAVGRLSAEKGFDVLLRAVAAMRARGQECHLTLAGEGPCRGELVALAQSLGVADAVTFAGFVSDMDSLYAAHDVLVLSSRTEGLPMTLLEAIRARLPVVATRVGGMPEVLDGGAGGLLVNPESSEELADAMVSIFTNPEQAHLRGERAFERAQSRYGIESTARLYVEAYSALLSEAGVKHEAVSG